MIQRIAIIFLILFLTACSSRVILKKETPVKIPFKIEKGEYVLNNYKLNYPLNLEEKQKFMEEFSDFLKKVILYNKTTNKEKKYIFLFNEMFYEDLEILKTEGNFKEEEIVLKTASSLNNEEINILKKMQKKELEKDNMTAQDVLNMQVSILMKTSKEEEKFEKNKVYTELDKEKIANEIKKNRKNLAELIEKVKFDFIIEIENPYEEKVKENIRYYYEKDIKVNVDSGVYEKLKDYTKTLYLKNLEEKDIDLLLSKNVTFKNKVIIIANKKYRGYTIFNGNYIFFEGGNEELEEYKGYKIDIKTEEVKLESIFQKEEINTLSEISGGK